MWSTPLKRTALDGTEYSLLLLDSEGIDAYDQTGTYSTQIFSLAVLLSSLFVYNQMGGIDEAALDRLSLVTEMTKHIRVRASEHRPSNAELGQFSPVFLWLLRDFYLDLTEEDKRISPRDYLESALQPIAGDGKAIAAKNEIRDSIRALFPDRECFTLVRPLNNERDLQRLDQAPFDSLRPEFRAGIDAFAKFVFERTKPKQLGSIVMTGPLLASLTQSFLDAINAGAVPTIATSWQNVEESECRRAYDAALELYNHAFSKSVVKDEEALRTIHDAAVEDALNVYNSEAVGAGAARQKYEKVLMVAFKRSYEENMHKIGMEAEMKCVKTVEKMDEKLWAVCQAPEVTLGQVLEVLNNLLEEYDQTTYGPFKWKKFKKFLQNSFEGPLMGITKRMNHQTATESTAFQMKCRSLEEKLGNVEKQLEGAQKDTDEWKRRYESVATEARSSEEAAGGRYMALQKTFNSLDEKYSVASHQLEVSRKEASDWRTRYEVSVSECKAGEEQLSVEIGALQSRCSAAEGRLAAAREQLQSAKEEALEWRRKHDLALEELHVTSERAAAMCERVNKQAQDRQDALRDEFFSSIATKDREIKDAQSKFEQDERHIAELRTHLEDQEFKFNVQEEELVRLRSELKQSRTAADAAKTKVLSIDKELNILKREKEHLEARLNIELKRSGDAETKLRLAEKELKSALDRYEKAWDEAETARKGKLEFERIAAERLAAQVSAERRYEVLVRERDDLSEEINNLRMAEQDTVSRVKSLDKKLEERDKEMGDLLDSSHKQRANTIHVLESLLASERQACGEANARAEALSMQLQAVQGKLDLLQQEFSTTRLNETVLDSKLRIRHGGPCNVSPSPGKRARVDDSMLEDSVHYAEVNANNQNTAQKPNNSSIENGCSPRHSHCDTPAKPDDNRTSTSDSKDSDDYTKFTIPRLKQELTKAGFAEELLQVKNPTKKEVIQLYERLVLQKGM
ncbi:hypothetical protein GOP47_0018640 [Adiantum capillus-veneris]|uniref:GB1/RHD3-type G domain-containing protein n=1 Tax=Adiantum capillus-veneris TaxID=13818 RepID=A0A9D4UF19_ADICA|nr:hypothetical protein GOP47_0018640 [Adiantum capillus-veneris]